jgi:hypothetical protein
LLDAAVERQVALLSRNFSVGGTTVMMGIKECNFHPLPENGSLEELVTDEEARYVVVRGAGDGADDVL